MLLVQDLLPLACAQESLFYDSTFCLYLVHIVSEIGYDANYVWKIQWTLINSIISSGGSLEMPVILAA